MSSWRAVVFDLDDTLYPEHQYVASGFRAVSLWAEERFSLPADRVYGELNSFFRAGIRGDTFNRWLALRALSSSWLGQMVEVYRGHCPEISLFPEVPVLLTSLRARVQLGLVSDGYHHVQRAKFRALRLDQFFSAVVFSDELGREYWKPSTQPFIKILELLQERADAVVYVGDNCGKDFIGARQAGLTTVWARHSGGDYAVQAPPSVEHAADMAIDSLLDLELVLGF